MAHSFSLTCYEGGGICCAYLHPLIKYYRNAAMSFHLHSICGCIFVIMARLKVQYGQT